MGREEVRDQRQRRVGVAGGLLEGVADYRGEDRLGQLLGTEGDPHQGAAPVAGIGLAAGVAGRF